MATEKSLGSGASGKWRTVHLVGVAVVMFVIGVVVGVAVDGPTERPAEGSGDEAESVVQASASEDEDGPTTGRPDPTEQQPASREPLPVETVSSSWHVDSGRMHYTVLFRNPNPRHFVDLPTVMVTARSSDGTVIATEEQTFFLLLPGSTVVESGSTSVAREPAELEVRWGDLEFVEGEAASYPRFEATGVTFNEGALGTWQVQGDLHNPYDTDFGTVRVAAVLLDDNNQPVGSHITFIDDVAADASVPFQVGSIEILEGTAPVNAEIYAVPWESL